MLDTRGIFSTASNMISSTTRIAGPYAGTGLQTAFPFAYKVFQTSDVLVLQTDASGNVSTLALTSQYSVALNSNQDTTPGGTVTLLTALPTGYTLVLSSQVPQLQATNLTNAGNFYPSVINNALDYLTILIQQMYTAVAGALRFPIGDSATNNVLPSATNRANNLLGFDAYGNPIAIAATAQSATALTLALATQGGAAMVGNTPTTGLISMTVQAVINELNTKKANLLGCTFTGPIFADNFVQLWSGKSSNSSNTGIGGGTLTSNTSGLNLTAAGTNALYSNTTGSGSSAFGASALAALLTGTGNLGIGVLAGADLTTGSNNSFLGTNTGRGITTGSGNTIIGSGVAGLASGLSNSIILANSAGTIQAQHDGTAWTLQGVVAITAGTASAHAAAISQVPGPLQTWQNVTSSRSASTNYTNSSGKMIAVAACCSANGSSGSQAFMAITSPGNPTITISGGTGALGYTPYIYAEIPPGAAYQLTGGGGGVSTWFELR